MSGSWLGRFAERYPKLSDKFPYAVGERYTKSFVFPPRLGLPGHQKFRAVNCGTNWGRNQYNYRIMIHKSDLQ